MRIIACFASTWDGKIADRDDPHARIGSKADLAHLRNVRNQADAILCGGETFRKYPNVRRGPAREQAPLQCLLTRTVNLPPESPVFLAEPAVPILVFHTEPVSEGVKAQYPAHVEWVLVAEANPVPVITAQLEKRGVKILLVEGGGHVMSLFLEARAVQELYLTLCPLFLGGQDDPALVSGRGFSVAGAPRTELLSCEQVGQELYLHLGIQYPE